MRDSSDQKRIFNVSSTTTPNDIWHLPLSLHSHSHLFKSARSSVNHFTITPFSVTFNHNLSQKSQQLWKSITMALRKKEEEEDMQEDAYYRRLLYPAADFSLWKFDEACSCQKHKCSQETYALFSGFHVQETEGQCTSWATGNRWKTKLKNSLQHKLLIDANDSQSGCL